LAAERLRKKYSHEVSDVKNFERYIEIIAKHVKDIGMMVEEFVQFARMPTPNFDDVDLTQLIREAIFSRRCLEKNITYVTEIENESIIVNCDARQISQVLLNLFKNAEESIEQFENLNDGKIIIRLIKNAELAELYIIDNGGGFSAELFDRLTEPYITSKSTGTGLGLAIVKKILDDHKAEISFSNNVDKSGAIIKLTFHIV
jgi:two-component system nitrogen regulation sensor histidine kinase NtrY